MESVIRGADDEAPKFVNGVLGKIVRAAGQEK